MKERESQHAAGGTAGRTIHGLRMLAGIAGFAIVTALAACGGDSGAPAGPTVQTTPVGAYTVSTINAKALPVAIFSGDNFSYEVTSGSLSLTGDGKFLLKQTFRQTIAGKVDTFIDSTFGTWALSGTTVNFISAQDSATDKATWSNTGTLTFVETEGPSTNTYVYQIKK